MPHILVISLIDALLRRVRDSVGSYRRGCRTRRCRSTLQKAVSFLTAPSVFARGGPAACGTWTHRCFNAHTWTRRARHATQTNRSPLELGFEWFRSGVAPRALPSGRGCALFGLTPHLCFRQRHGRVRTCGCLQVVADKTIPQGCQRTSDPA